MHDGPGEPELSPAQLARLRADLARLADPSGAPAVPAEVTTRVTAALRAQRGPAHAARRAGPPLRLLAALVGAGAAVAAVVVGVAMLHRPAPPAYPSGPTAEKITVTPFPLPAARIAELLAAPPDLGPLTDPQRRASCLSALGYPPGTDVLGARPVDVGGAPAVVLVLDGGDPGHLTAVAVGPGCSTAHPEVVADTVLERP